LIVIFWERQIKAGLFYFIVITALGIVAEILFFLEKIEAKSPPLFTLPVLSDTPLHLERGRGGGRKGNAQMKGL